MRSLIRRLDAYLRHRQGVVELSRDPRCVFRIRVVRAQHPLRLSRRTVRAGAELLELHLWNENLPQQPGGSPDLRFGVEAARRIRWSLAIVADRLETCDELRDVEAVGSVHSLLLPGAGTGGRNLLQRFGFELAPDRIGNPIGELGKRLHAWMMLWAFNPSLARRRAPWSLARTQAWMSKEDLLSRYGGGTARSVETANTRARASGLVDRSPA